MEPTQARYDVIADQGQNTLHLVLQGQLTDDEVERLAVEAVTSARHLSPGFTVITDVSEFDPHSTVVVEPLVRARGPV
ncbi:hypothetical protein ACFQL1_19910 [Halomicroarcula sp. GCM10025709]|uniref:hypothetical protein n=1 Tax=Halomicroarcula sp. GCM10025709 TaxID=3252669 RepID=UPI00360CDFD8